MTELGAHPGYEIPSGSCDELLDADGNPLPHAAPLMAALARLGPDALDAAGKRRDTIFMQQGITFEVAGSDGERRDRAWPLDLVPRVLTAIEWTTIKRGLAQRIRALNAFVDDVYHAHEIVRAGIVPWSLIVSRASFARPVHGVRAPGGVYCHVCGCDLVRDGDGSWRVLEDNVRTPSGISYVLENRVAMTRLMPELFAGHRVRAVDHYPSLLLDALRAVAPAVESHPTVVLWTPGPLNSAYFEHAFLARQMGVELVEAGDLVVRDAVCYMRTTAGLQRVHTIYRRLDDDFIDPLEFRPDSMLGVPGSGAGLPRRDSRNRQRDRHRGRRRQGDLPLRARDDPLLPRRGADPPQRGHVPAQRRAVAQRGAAPVARAGHQADLRIGRQGRVHRAPRERRRARAAGAADRAASRIASSLKSSSISRPRRPRPATGAWHRATSTCARSPCSGRRSGSSPAA